MSGSTPVVSATQTSGTALYSGISAAVSNFATQTVFNIQGTSGFSRVFGASGEFIYLNNETLTFSPLDLNNLSSFQVTGTNYGTFTVSPAQAAQAVVTKDVNNNILGVYLVGTFTPAAPGSMSQYATAQAASMTLTGSTNGSSTLSASMSMSAQTVP